MIYVLHGLIKRVAQSLAATNTTMLAVIGLSNSIHVYDELCPRFLSFIFLWPPYGIGQAIIFSSCGFLWSPYGIGQIIIFSSCRLFYLSFPRLISAVAEWMSAILPHMVRP